MRSLTIAALAASALLAGCQRPPVAYGDPNSIIVVAPDNIWNAIKDSVDTALQRQILSPRPEHTFNVTQVSPESQKWGVLRQFKQVIVIGRAQDGWVKPALSKSDTTIKPPMLVTVKDVWADQQLVTAWVLPQSHFVQGALAEIPTLYAQLDQRFQEYARERMFASGIAKSLRDSLEANAGFSLTFPKIYQVDSTGDSVFIAYNNLRDPKELMRFFIVDHRPGLDTLSTEQILQWRESLMKSHFARPQVTQREPIKIRDLEVGDVRMHEVQGVWSSPPGAWPGAGPFIDRVIRCPAENRTYLVDAWLYAPDSPKYEYMIQLNTILDSFRCAGAAAARTAGDR